MKLDTNNVSFLPTQIGNKIGKKARLACAIYMLKKQFYPSPISASIASFTAQATKNDGYSAE